MSARPLRLGVSGLGRAFTLMLPTFLADPRVELVAATDPRPAALDRFVTDFGGRAHESLESLAADPAVEAIYVASPHQFHARQTEIAAAHGKHVLVEKPMALGIDECRRMIAACQAAGVRLIVGHCHSFDSPILKARELIDGGALGRVRMIQALNYTDFLYRPRRPEELDTAAGGGVVFSQAAHQVDIVRLLAGSPAVSVRAVLGAWDDARPTEGAYTALMWFADGAFASLTYSGYGHFDSDEWCGWIGEMGGKRGPESYGVARRRLRGVASSEAEATLKASSTYGGLSYVSPSPGGVQAQNQHFGPIIISCERGDLRPMPDAVVVYGDEAIERHPLAVPAVPRFEVIDELYNAVVNGVPPTHDGNWAMGTLEVCLAFLRSAREGREVRLDPQVTS